MSLVEINWQPSDRHLRQFGIVCLLALPFIGWVWGGSLVTVGQLAAVGLVIAITGIVSPKLVKPLFLGMTIATIPIGMVVGELAILLIYYAVFLPFGLVFRVLKRDALKLKIDRTRSTYWEAKKKPPKVGNYFRQY